jgi:Peptidase family M28
MTTVETLERFSGRGAGSDAERRAGLALATELWDSGHQAVIETFWSRPNWALAHAWHVAFAIAGSLVSVASAVAGIILLGLALISTLADTLAGVSLGRRLTPERASQDVVAAPEEANQTKTRLVLTANYDAGRAGLAYRAAIRRPLDAVNRILGGRWPGWLAWLAIAMLWLLALAILRLEHHTGPGIGALQLVPTVSLVIAFALLIELALAPWSPAGGDNGSGVAAALAIAAALAQSPPANLDVEVVLTGAGDQDQLGLRRYLRRRRHERRPANTVVLGLAACAAGSPRWWSSDGALVPLAYGRSLRRVANTVATAEPHLNVRGRRGRGATPALPARVAGLPAITIGCLDDGDLSAHSHQRSDVAANVDSNALDAAIQFGLLLIDGVDAALAEPDQRRSAAPA